MENSDQSYSKAQKLFEHWLGIPPEKKDSWLEAECGSDSGLRERVEALIHVHRNADELIASKPAIEASIAESLATLPVGVDAFAPRGQIGPYRLREIIAEGGMGVVYLAEQNEPIKRRVALKIIKPGMDSKQVIARFEAERQALAMMDHPNIARVIDGGVTEQGRPFFAMEYVRGVPLATYCDDAKLSIRKRLELFIPICQAIQHAHQKGIIHRDLKPSNILVGLYDGKPVPKVIDFGLAKAMHQSLTDKSVFTAHGVMVGTPLYMSPEQAEYSNLDIDTRSDIYALGVILYELLTGSTPLEQVHVKKAAFNEVLRLIKEFDPPKPSMRLSGSDTLPSVAAQRNIEPSQLPRRVSGDLDWVVMKALEKERTRRYDSASGLAEDIQRHLSDQPVSAGPPSVRYRVQKFVKRNRTGVLAAGFAGLVLAASFGTTVAFWAQRTLAIDQLAREQRYATVTTSVLETLVKDDYRWLSPGEQTGMAGSLARARAVLELRGSEVSPVVKCTIQNVIFAQLAAVGDYEAAKDGLSAVTKDLATNAPDSLRIRAEAHFHLAEALWLLDSRERSEENFREALRLADEGGFRIDGAHYAAGFAGVFVGRASLSEETTERSRLRDEALKLIERAEEAREPGNEDSERAYLLAQYQRAFLLTWVDENSEAGIKLLRNTIKRQLAAKSRATVDALEISFVQLWSMLVETGNKEEAIEATLWWENQARELIGPASRPAIEAMVFRADTHFKNDQVDKSVALLDKLLEEIVRWRGEASDEAKGFATDYYLPYMQQHFGENERAQKAKDRFGVTEP